MKLPSEINLKNFSKDVYSILAQDLALNSSFNDWGAALDYIYKISKNERIILVIDEYHI